MPTRSSENEGLGSEILNIPNFLYIYKEGSAVNWSAVKSYLESKVEGKVNIKLRERFIRHHLGKDKDLKDIANKLARAKVFSLSDPTKTYDPFPVEIEHEKAWIIDSSKAVPGVMYDGLKLQKLARELLPDAESSFKHLHIVFTNRLFGTWERGDGRYHGRVNVLGFPSIISTTGIVEAPAKPREFYILRKALVSSGMARELVEEELKSKFKGRFIDYDDERLTEIVKGYVMQAFFYHTTFEPFCHDKDCRLYNAHWQEEMIHAQLEGEDFCERHHRILETIRTGKK